MTEFFKTVFGTTFLVWILAALFGFSGCSKGTNGYLEVANPQTSVSVNPITKQVTFFTNDGREIFIEGLESGFGEGKFLNVKKLTVTEKSVENRQANLAQLEIQRQMNQDMFEGATKIVSASVGEAIRTTGEVLTQGVKIDTPIGSGQIGEMNEVGTKSAPPAGYPMSSLGTTGSL